MSLANDRSSRRLFLGQGAAVAGALTAAAYGQEPDVEEERVRVLVIGSGARGADLIRSLATVTSAEIVGVADDYPPHLAKGLEYAGKQARGYEDYRRALTELRPAAVVIAVPLHLHYAVAMDSLAAGCAVFCEKTMCRTIREALDLTAAVKRDKRVFQIGLQRRANPIYLQAQAMVESGLLGRITAVKAQWHRHNSWRRPLSVARDHADYARLERKLNWRLYEEYSGGLMTELASHQMDVVNWLLGTTPTRVFCTGGVDFWRDGREVPDNIFAIYEYERQPAVAGKPTAEERNSFTVRVTYSSLCNNAYEGAAELIMGTKGTLYLTSGKGLFFQETAPEQIAWAAGGDATARAATNAGVVTAGQTLKLSNDPWAHRGKPLEIDNESGDDTRGELVAFIDHARRGDPATIADVDVGLSDAVTVLLANQAREAQGWVKFPEEVRTALRPST